MPNAHDTANPRPDSAHASQPPQSERPASPLLTLAASDADYVAALQNADLARELDEGEFLRITSLLPEGPANSARHLDMLLVHYASRGDLETRARREQADRFIAYAEQGGETVSGVVGRLARLTRELHGLHLERATDAPDTELRLVTATASVPLTEEDNEQHIANSITVRAVVRACNKLLRGNSVAVRFVPLKPDGGREAYVGVRLDQALKLLGAGCLEDTNDDDMRMFAGW